MPTLDSDDVTVVAPSKAAKRKKVLVKDLQELSRNDNSRMQSLCHYVPEQNIDSSDESSTKLQVVSSKSNNDNNNLLRPIF